MLAACRSLFGKRQEQHWEHQNQIQKDLKMQVGRYPPSVPDWPILHEYPSQRTAPTGQADGVCLYIGAPPRGAQRRRDGQGRARDGRVAAAQV